MARKVAKKKAPHPIVSETGARFRLARETLDLTQREVATMGGCLQSSVSRFETGERGLEAHLLLPLLRAGHVAGISIPFVLTGEGAPTRRFAVTDETGPEILEHLGELVRHLQARHRPADPPRELPAASGHSEQ